jgi:hypothetical protein
MRRHAWLTLLLALAAFGIGRLSADTSVFAQDATTTAAEEAVPAVAGPGTEDAPTHEVGEVPAGQPRYLAAMRTELDALGLEGACAADDPQRAHCDVRLQGETSHRTFNVRMVYSDATDTVYFYIDNYLLAPADAPTTNELLRHLMELNWRMLTGKFEWDASNGDVRIAMTMNTDSNFDRRSFRSIVRSLQEQADRLYAELARIAPQP